eukprot:TRINITY_DN3202_c0_g1_i6.p1 TRINITY_DN3202_c0_g1~~TRINITY_DN3202_c0_g1_i6.p1  ORF type:complete len:1003 (+),score=382.48 TRINITY_DN3202_c0_g1_i6:165-3173(+)
MQPVVVVILAFAAASIFSRERQRRKSAEHEKRGDEDEAYDEAGSAVSSSNRDFAFRRQRMGGNEQEANHVAQGAENDKYGPQKYPAHHTPSHGQQKRHPTTHQHQQMHQHQHQHHQYLHQRHKQPHIQHHQHQEEEYDGHAMQQHLHSPLKSPSVKNLVQQFDGPPYSEAGSIGGGEEGGGGGGGTGISSAGSNKPSLVKKPSREERIEQGKKLWATATAKLQERRLQAVCDTAIVHCQKREAEGEFASLGARRGGYDPAGVGSKGDPEAIAKLKMKQKGGSWWSLSDFDLTPNLTMVAERKEAAVNVRTREILDMGTRAYGGKVGSAAASGKEGKGGDATQALQDQIKFLESQNARMRSELDGDLKFLEEHADLEVELERRRMMLARQQARLEFEVDHKKDELQNLEEEIRKRRESLEAKEKSEQKDVSEALSRARKELESVHKEAAAQVAVIETSKAKVEKEVQAKKKELTRIEKSIESRRDQQEKLEAELQKRKDELEKLEKQVEVKKKEVERKATGRASEMEKKVADLKVQAASLDKELLEKKELLQRSMWDMEERAAALKGKNEELEKEMFLKQKKVSEHEVDAAKAEEREQATREEVMSLSLEKVQLEGELVELREEIAKAMTGLQAGQSTTEILEQLQRGMREVAEAKAQLGVEKTLAEQQGQQTVKQLAEAQEKLVALEKALNTMDAARKRWCSRLGMDPETDFVSLELKLVDTLDTKERLEKEAGVLTAEKERMERRANASEIVAKEMIEKAEEQSRQSTTDSHSTTQQQQGDEPDPLLPKRIWDLLEQLEAVKVTSMTEEEELVRLRWITACLRGELHKIRPGIRVHHLQYHSHALSSSPTHSLRSIGSASSAKSGGGANGGGGSISSDQVSGHTDSVAASFGTTTVGSRSTSDLTTSPMAQGHHRKTKSSYYLNLETSPMTKNASSAPVIKANPDSMRSSHETNGFGLKSKTSSTETKGKNHHNWFHRSKDKTPSSSGSRRPLSFPSSPKT